MIELANTADILVPFETLTLPAQETFTMPLLEPRGMRYGDCEIRSWFGGKTEAPTDETELVFKRLCCRNFVCESEISLSLCEAPPLSVSQIIALLYRPSADLPSPLLLTGWPNLFHSVDKSGVRRTIQARWFPSHCGWELRAHEVAGRSPIYRQAHVVMPLAKGPH